MEEAGFLGHGFFIRIMHQSLVCLDIVGEVQNPRVGTSNQIFLFVFNDQACIKADPFLVCRSDRSDEGVIER